MISPNSHFFHELGSSDLIDLDVVIDHEQSDQAIDRGMISTDSDMLKDTKDCMLLAFGSYGNYY
jgi:hypothetical protein